MQLELLALQQDILRFQIAMDNPVFLQELQLHQNLPRYVLYMWIQFKPLVVVSLHQLV